MVSCFPLPLEAWEITTDVLINDLTMALKFCGFIPVQNTGKPSPAYTTALLKLVINYMKEHLH